MNEVCISVIVPIYNSESFLKRCIDSILKQTFMKYEIILVNDGSTDGSCMVMDRYKDNHRIRIIDSTHRGVSEARNIGLKAAKEGY